MSRRFYGYLNYVQNSHNYNTLSSVKNELEVPK